MSLRIEVAHTAGDFALDVHLSAGAGLTALVGPSGSGKTTLLNVVAGVLRPDRGLVKLEGETLVDTAARLWTPPHARQIGYVFQEHRLFPHMTVRQNLLYGRWFRRHVNGGPAPDDVIGLLNLGALLGRRPMQLSGGEKQRVAFARAIAGAPRLLLLDEPLTSLDPALREDLLGLIESQGKVPGRTLVIVTHDEPVARRVARRVLSLLPATTLGA